MSTQEETHGHPKAGYEKGNLISWNWLSSRMLASATTRLPVLNTCQEKDFPCSENSRVQKTSIQNSNQLDLEIWFGLGGYQK
jgi:hypothetical protein